MGTGRSVVMITNLGKISNSEIICCVNKAPKRSIIIFEDLDRLYDHHKELKKGTGLSTEGLLHVLDGIGSPEGRIMVITSNDPSVLPDALFRPGRIDRKFDFPCSRGSSTSTY